VAAAGEPTLGSEAKSEDRLSCTADHNMVSVPPPLWQVTDSRDDRSRERNVVILPSVGCCGHMSSRALVQWTRWTVSLVSAKEMPLYRIGRKPLLCRAGLWPCRRTCPARKLSVLPSVPLPSILIARKVIRFFNSLLFHNSEEILLMCTSIHWTYHSYAPSGRHLWTTNRNKLGVARRGEQ
jgi:hypothetical protein